MLICLPPSRWLLLGFQREFEHSDALRLFEILSCDHLELISQQVERACYQERLSQKCSTGKKKKQSSNCQNKYLPLVKICLVLFTEHDPDTELQAINTDFTFELFICAAILLENRESLLRCRDEVQLIQFTSRLVCTMRHVNLHHKASCLWMCWWNLCLVLCSLQGKLDLNSTLKKAEHHLYNYCKRYAWDYMSNHCRANKSKGEDFFYQLRNLLVLKW